MISCVDFTDTPSKKKISFAAATSKMQHEFQSNFYGPTIVARKIELMLQFSNIDVCLRNGKIIIKEIRSAEFR